MNRKSGQGFKERLKGRREQRRTRSIERAMPRHAPIDYSPRGRGGIKASRGGAGGGGTA